MKKSLLVASLAVTTASALGMNCPEQGERRSSMNMVSISEPSERNESLTVDSETTTWWNDGLRDGKDEFLKIIKEEKKKCKNREKEINVFNSKDSNGRNILMYATENADVEIMTLLLDMNVIDINAKDINGNTALLIASETGDIEKMRLLLSRGADVNVRNSDKETALLIAVKSRDDEMIELLIKYNALSKNDFKSFDEIVSNRYKMNLSLVKEKINTIGKKVEKELQVLVNALNSCGKSKESKNKLREALNNWKEINAPIMKKDLTPLTYAAANDMRSATEVLLTFKDINVNAKWKGGNTTTLSVAAANGHDKIVDLLLGHRDIQINAADESGFTPLFYATNRGRLSILKKLIEHGAEVNCQDRLGNAPIMGALAFGYIDILNELINAGAALDLKNNKGRTPLLFLAAGVAKANIGNNVVSSDCILEMLEILLSQDNTNVNVQDNDGNTALIIAAGEGRIKIVNRLLSKKVKVDIVNNKGNNAIMEAVQNDRKNVVQELLKQEYFRKNINYKNKKGQSVLSIATVEGYTGLVDLLLKQKDDKGNLIVDINTRNMYGNAPLMEAVFYDHLDMVNNLLEQSNIEVSCVGQFEQTSLMISAHKGIYSITKKILDRIPTDLRKSYVNVKSLNQVTAMSAAVFNNNAKMVKLLLGYDADVNTKFEDETMLMFSARMGFTEIVKLLLDAGADKSIKNNAGETALDIVKELDFRDEIRKLLDKKEPGFSQSELSAKEVNIKFKKAAENKSAKEMDKMLRQYNKGNRMISDESINEMFVNVAGSSSGEIFNLLIPYVKDFNFKDKNGNTALIAAAKNGQDFIVSTLLKYPGRIDINAENEEGYTALMVAAEKGYKFIVRELLDKGAKISNSINSEAALSIVSSAKANNNKSVLATYEKIEKLLREKGQKQDNKLSMSIGSWPVYAGNDFYKQLGELDKDFPNLGRKVREIIEKLSVNPNYKSDKDDNPEAWNFGCYSRRLNEKHRLIYRLHGGVIQCLFCKDHNTKLERADKSDVDRVLCKYKWEQNENGKYDFIVLNHEDRGTLNYIADDQRPFDKKVIKNKRSKKRLQKNRSKAKEAFTLAMQAIRR